MQKVAANDLETGLKMSGLRRQKQLKSYWVAEQIGIHPSMLSELENGKRRWNPDLQAAYLKAIGYTNHKPKTKGK